MNAFALSVNAGTFNRSSGTIMDPKIGRDQHTPPDQQTPLERQPASDQFVRINPDQITPAGNEAFLHQHQKQLRSEYPSSDLSEVSSHTEHAGFPGSRHSSLNTEPLTLDAEQIHDAKVSFYSAPGNHTIFEPLISL